MPTTHTRFPKIFLPAILPFVLILLAAAIGSAQTTVTYPTPGSYSWTAPSGVTSVQVQIWGAGGAGGGPGSDAYGNALGGGGGGGGGYTPATVSVSPGQTYTIVVGGFSGDGGGSSAFGVSVGNGAAAAGNSGGAGGSGTTTGSVGSNGDVEAAQYYDYLWCDPYYGPDYGNCYEYTGYYGAAYGGPGANGANGGNGGQGGEPGNQGYNASAPGGGGGGGGISWCCSYISTASSVTYGPGGNGAAGQVIFTYTATPLLTQTITSSPAGRSLTVDGTACTAPCSFQWYAGSTHTIAAATQAGASGTQYAFTSWSDSGAASHSVAPSSATTYTAGFTTQYYLTTAASPSADGTISPGSGWYNSGTVVSVSAAANGGYQFSGFSGALSGATTPQNVTMSAPQAATANFSAPLLTDTITTSPAGLSLAVDGNACPAPCSVQWYGGTNHTITAATQAGTSGTQYVFANWSDSGAGSHTVTTPSSATTYTASFTTQYYLTTTASPTAGGTISPGSGWYNSGATVSVSATPNGGYQFIGFSGALNGTASPQNLAMSGPETVTATFQQPLSITTSSLPNGQINTSYSQTLTANGGTGSYTWSLASGSLPAGLSLATGGVLSGTPTVSATSSFTARVTDSGSHTVTAALAVTVWNGPPDFNLSVTPASQTVTPSSSAQFTVMVNPINGFTGAVTFSEPAYGTGVIFVPNPATTQTTMIFPPQNANGSYHVPIFGQSGSLVHTINVDLTYNGSSRPTVSCAPLRNPISQNETVTFNAFGANGTPPYTYTWSGVLSGAGQTQPFQSSTVGTYTAVVGLQDAHGLTTSSLCSVTVQSQSTGSLTITSRSPLPGGTLNASYSTYLSATGGTPPYSWSVVSGSLPSGLILSNGGAISGTPTTAGPYSFGLRVIDNASHTANATPSLAVALLPSNLSAACSVLGNVASPGATVTFSAAASGGAAPYAYLWSGSVSGNSQTVATSFGQVGTYTGSLTVTDSLGASVPASCSVAVASALPQTYNCTATFIQDAGTLVHLPDGTVYAHWGIYVNWAAPPTPITDWQAMVQQATLTAPPPSSQQFMPPDTGWVTSPTPAAIRTPDPPGSVSVLGFGGYHLSADFQLKNANCKPSPDPNVPLGTPTDIGIASGTLTIPPPTLSSLSPSSGAVGTVASGITARGVTLSGTTAVVITDQNGNQVTGIPTTLDVQDDNTVILSLDLTASGVTPGVYNVALTSYGVNTGPQSFEVADASPYITGIQGPYTIGQTSYISIYGINFGTGCPAPDGQSTCPGAGLAICQSGSADPCGPSNNGADVRPSITYWSSNQVNAALQIDPSASGLYDAQITSAGASGNGFLSTQQIVNNTHSNRKRFAVNPSPTYSLKVNGGAVSQNTCAYINATPQMPQITAQVVDSTGNPVSGSGTWQLITEFRYVTRGPIVAPAKVGPVVPATDSPVIQQTPSTPVAGSGTYTWNPTDFAQILGGDSRIEWTFTPSGGTAIPKQLFYFVICGTNPDFNTLSAALTASSNNGNTYWFPPNISNHETAMSQFCDGSRTQGSPYCSTPGVNTNGEPIVGGGAGYGIGQLDPAPSVAAIWNWRTNVTEMLKLLDAFGGPQQPSAQQVTSDIRVFPRWFRYVQQWQQYNASTAGQSNPAGEPTETVGNTQVSFCSFAAPHVGQTATSSTGQPNTYWYADAILMKAYARGATNPYMAWDNTALAWVAAPTSDGGAHNFVYEFCTCSDPSRTLPDATCKHTTP